MLFQISPFSPILEPKSINDPLLKTSTSSTTTTPSTTTTTTESSTVSNVAVQRGSWKPVAHPFPDKNEEENKILKMVEMIRNENSPAISDIERMQAAHELMKHIDPDRIRYKVRGVTPGILKNAEVIPDVADAVLKKSPNEEYVYYEDLPTGPQYPDNYYEYAYPILEEDKIINLNTAQESASISVQDVIAERPKHPSRTQTKIVPSQGSRVPTTQITSVPSFQPPFPISEHPSQKLLSTLKPDDLYDEVIIIEEPVKSILDTFVTRRPLILEKDSTNIKRPGRRNQFRNQQKDVNDEAPRESTMSDFDQAHIKTTKASPQTTTLPMSTTTTTEKTTETTTMSTTSTTTTKKSPSREEIQTLLLDLLALSPSPEVIRETFGKFNQSEKTIQHNSDHEFFPTMDEQADPVNFEEPLLVGESDNNQDPALISESDNNESGSKFKIFTIENLEKNYNSSKDLEIPEFTINMEEDIERKHNVDGNIYYQHSEPNQQDQIDSKFHNDNEKGNYYYDHENPPKTNYDYPIDRYDSVDYTEDYVQEQGPKTQLQTKLERQYQENIEQLREQQKQYELLRLKLEEQHKLFEEQLRATMVNRTTEINQINHEPMDTKTSLSPEDRLVTFHNINNPDGKLVTFHDVTPNKEGLLTFHDYGIFNPYSNDPSANGPRVQFINNQEIAKPETIFINNQETNPENIFLLNHEVQEPLEAFTTKQSYLTPTSTTPRYHENVQTANQPSDTMNPNLGESLSVLSQAGINTPEELLAAIENELSAIRTDYSQNNAQGINSPDSQFNFEIANENKKYNRQPTNHPSRVNNYQEISKVVNPSREINSRTHFDSQFIDSWKDAFSQDQNAGNRSPENEYSNVNNHTPEKSEKSSIPQSLNERQSPMMNSFNLLAIAQDHGLNGIQNVQSILNVPGALDQFIKSQKHLNPNIQIIAFQNPDDPDRLITFQTAVDHKIQTTNLAPNQISVENRVGHFDQNYPVNNGKLSSSTSDNLSHRQATNQISESTPDSFTREKFLKQQLEINRQQQMLLRQSQEQLLRSMSNNGLNQDTMFLPGKNLPYFDPIQLRFETPVSPDSIPIAPPKILQTLSPLEQVPPSTTTSEVYFPPSTTKRLTIWDFLTTRKPLVLDTEVVTSISSDVEYKHQGTTRKQMRPVYVPSTSSEPSYIRYEKHSDGTETGTESYLENSHHTQQSFEFLTIPVITGDHVDFVTVNRSRIAYPKVVIVNTNPASKSPSATTPMTPSEFNQNPVAGRGDGGGLSSYSLSTKHLDTLVRTLIGVSGTTEATPITEFSTSQTESKIAQLFSKWTDGNNSPDTTLKEHKNDAREIVISDSLDAINSDSVWNSLEKHLALAAEQASLTLHNKTPVVKNIQETYEDDSINIFDAIKDLSEKYSNNPNLVKQLQSLKPKLNSDDRRKKSLENQEWASSDNITNGYSNNPIIFVSTDQISPENISIYPQMDDAIEKYLTERLENGKPVEVRPDDNLPLNIHIGRMDGNNQHYDESASNQAYLTVKSSDNDYVTDDFRDSQTIQNNENYNPEIKTKIFPSSGPRYRYINDGEDDVHSSHLNAVPSFVPQAGSRVLSSVDESIQHGTLPNGITIKNTDSDSSITDNNNILLRHDSDSHDNPLAYLETISRNPYPLPADGGGISARMELADHRTVAPTLAGVVVTSNSRGNTFHFNESSQSPLIINTANSVQTFTNNKMQPEGIPILPGTNIADYNENYAVFDKASTPESSSFHLEKSNSFQQNYDFPHIYNNSVNITHEPADNNSRTFDENNLSNYEDVLNFLYNNESDTGSFSEIIDFLYQSSQNGTELFNLDYFEELFQEEQGEQKKVYSSNLQHNITVDSISDDYHNLNSSEYTSNSQMGSVDKSGNNFLLTVDHPPITDPSKTLRVVDAEVNLDDVLDFLINETNSRKKMDDNLKEKFPPAPRQRNQPYVAPAVRLNIEDVTLSDIHSQITASPKHQIRLTLSMDKLSQYTNEDHVRSLRRIRRSAAPFHSRVVSGSYNPFWYLNQPFIYNPIPLNYYNKDLITDAMVQGQHSSQILSPELPNSNDNQQSYIKPSSFNNAPHYQHQTEKVEPVTVYVTTEDFVHKHENIEAPLDSSSNFTSRSHGLVTTDSPVHTFVLRQGQTLHELLQEIFKKLIEEEKGIANTDGDSLVEADGGSSLLINGNVEPNTETEVEINSQNPKDVVDNKSDYIGSKGYITNPNLGDYLESVSDASTANETKNIIANSLKDKNIIHLSTGVENTNGEKNSDLGTIKNPENETTVTVYNSTFASVTSKPLSENGIFLSNLTFLHNEQYTRNVSLESSTTNLKAISDPKASDVMEAVNRIVLSHIDTANSPANNKSNETTTSSTVFRYTTRRPTTTLSTLSTKTEDRHTSSTLPQIYSETTKKTLTEEEYLQKYFNGLYLTSTLSPVNDTTNADMYELYPVMTRPMNKVNATTTPPNNEATFGNLKPSTGKPLNDSPGSVSYDDEYEYHTTDHPKNSSGSPTLITTAAPLITNPPMTVITSMDVSVRSHSQDVNGTKLEANDEGLIKMLIFYGR